MKNIYSVMAAIMLLLMLTIPLLAVGSAKSQKPAPLTTTVATTKTTKATAPVKAGYFKILDMATGKVTEIAETEYVFGVVASEMPVSFEPEALKAQAVAAYTVALMRKNENMSSNDATLKGADLSNDPSKDQGFITREQAVEKWGKNYVAYAKKIDDAVSAVKGKVIKYNGMPILAAYHAISSGKTEMASVVWGDTNMPYLKSVESIGDLLAPDYQTTATFTKEQFIANAKKLGATLTGDPKTWIKEPKRSASGTVTEYILGDKKVNGQQIRSAFSLRSANFDIVYKDLKLCFTVRGYGHGVGMSQYGANYMAKQGSSYIEILKWYYSGCVIE